LHNLAIALDVTGDGMMTEGADNLFPDITPDPLRATGGFADPLRATGGCADPLRATGGCTDPLRATGGCADPLRATGGCADPLRIDIPIFPVSLTHRPDAGLQISSTAHFCLHTLTGG